MLHITKIIAREQYRLEVLLDNGTIVILNMAPRLNSIRFMALENPLFFLVQLQMVNIFAGASKWKFRLAKYLIWRKNKLSIAMICRT